MEFTNTLTLDHPIDDVWRALIDVERVTPCVPGAEVVGREDDAYDMALKVKVGPVAMRYRGQVQLVEADEEAHRARLEGRMREVRGQGTVKASISMHASGDADRTTMELRTDVALTGKVASLGQGMLGDVAASVLDAFARNLEAMLGRPAADAPQPPAAVGAPAPPPLSPPPADQASVAAAVLRRTAARSAIPVAAGVGLLGLLALVLRGPGRRRG